MKAKTPTLLPLFRSRTQGDVAAALFLDPVPGHRYSLTELSEAVGASLPQVSREVQRWAESGLVSTTKSGNMRFVDVNRDNPAHIHLTRLLYATFGPLPVLKSALVEAEGVDAAVIYGSWAARYQDEPGPVPGDIDVLIVGDMSRADADRLSQEASSKLFREVNIRVLSPNEWRSARNRGFRETVERRPVVSLVGSL